MSETVQVTAESPVLDTGPLEAGTLIDNQQLMDLPVLGNNPTLLSPDFTITLTYSSFNLCVSVTLR